MKVQNMTSSRGNTVANQFIISDSEVSLTGEYDVDYFQSYDSLIAKIVHIDADSNPRHLSKLIYLDSKYWDYSVTTGKYRNQFLGETKKETQAKIDSGEYILTNLN